MRTGRTRLRQLDAAAAGPRVRQGPKTLQRMRPIHAPRSVLEVFASTPLEAIRRDDGQVRLVKAGRRRKAGAQAASPAQAVVKMVPSGNHFVGVLDVAPPADPARER